MTESEGLLNIRAAYSGRTYIGATFCAGEEALRELCEVASADTTIDVNEARQAVQNGEAPQDVARDYDFHRVLQGNRSLDSIIMPCLGRIAAGQCPVYPI